MRPIACPSSIVFGLALAALSALSACAAHAQDRPCPPDSLLAGITARGRLIAGHDHAAWHGTDAFMALRPDTAGLRSYVVVQDGGGWRVLFGALAAQGDTFHVAYEARRTGSGGEHDGFVAAAVRPWRAETGAAARAGNAVRTVRVAHGPLRRPYVFSAIPADGGEWWVYATPAVTRHDVWPLGADVRYRVSADGRRVLATRELHRAIIEFGGRDSTGKPLQIESGFHVAVVDVVPEDTDVFHVLQRTPRVPQLIVTDAWLFRVQVDGTISCLGDRRRVLGDDK